MFKAIKGIRKAKEWQQIYDQQAPRAGDPAPDFDLSSVDSGHRVRLSEICGKRPVALVFGSYT